jgi:hypothetical protein
MYEAVLRYLNYQQLYADEDWSFVDAINRTAMVLNKKSLESETRNRRAENQKRTNASVTTEDPKRGHE